MADYAVAPLERTVSALNSYRPLSRYYEGDSAPRPFEHRADLGIGTGAGGEPMAVGLPKRTHERVAVFRYAAKFADVCLGST
jgi:hypothetical protein